MLRTFSKCLFIPHIPTLNGQSSLISSWAQRTRKLSSCQWCCMSLKDQIQWENIVYGIKQPKWFTQISSTALQFPKQFDKTSAYQNTLLVGKQCWSFDFQPSRDCWFTLTHTHTHPHTHHTHTVNHSILPHRLFSSDQVTLSDEKPELQGHCLEPVRRFLHHLLNYNQIHEKEVILGETHNQEGISYTVCHAPSQIPWNPCSLVRQLDGRDPCLVPASV